LRAALLTEKHFSKHLTHPVFEVHFKMETLAAVELQFNEVARD